MDLSGAFSFPLTVPILRVFHCAKSFDFCGNVPVLAATQRMLAPAPANLKSAELLLRPLIYVSPGITAGECGGSFPECARPPKWLTLHPWATGSEPGLAERPEQCTKAKLRKCSGV